MISAVNPLPINASPAIPVRPSVTSNEELEKTFRTAVAGMFYGQLMKALRSTQGETAYLHGGQAERMFEAQLDQQLVEDLSEGHNGAFVHDLYQQFRINLKLPVDAGPPQITQPLNSASAVNSSQAQGLSQLLQLSEASQETRSVSERILGTTDTTALSGLIRK